MITNVHMDCYSPGSEHAALSWEQDGCRFHIWIDVRLPSEKWSPDRLYKNPPLAAKSGDPQYFNTRTLNPRSRPSADMIAEAVRQCKARDLIQQAKALWAAEQEQKRLAENESRRDATIREAAHDLLVALKLARAEIHNPGAARAGGKDIEEIVSDAIAKAEGQP